MDKDGCWYLVAPLYKITFRLANMVFFTKTTFLYILNIKHIELTPNIRNRDHVILCDMT